MSNLVELRSKLAHAPTRLLLGIVIMLVSGFVGNNVVQMNDATAVEVYVAKSNLSAGEAVSISDFERTSISKTVDANQWMSFQEITSKIYLSTSLRRGDVLRRSDVTSNPSGVATVSILAQRGRVPLNIEIGDTVDIWRLDQTPMLLAEGAAVAALEVTGGDIVLTLIVPSESVGRLLLIQEIAITIPG